MSFSRSTLSLAKLLLLASLVSLSGGLLLPSPAAAQLRIRDICRLKGQEENTLHGLGLVVGLKGTGDGDSRPTTRALARMMDLMGSPIPGNSPVDIAKELEDVKNVALVFVTATVPAAGARQGDKINCQISALSAKSLEGGRLMLTPLLGPRPGSNRVYALAQGAISVEDPRSPTSGKIFNGCRLEESFHNEFVQEGKITLVLDSQHAAFATSQDIAELVNSQPDFQESNSGTNEMAVARDQVNVEVRIPAKYAESPVLFVSLVQNLRFYNPQQDARVVVNRKTGTVVIGADVTIGPVAVTHKNIVVEAGSGATAPFVPVDPSVGVAAGQTKLKSLVEALNAVKVPSADIIDIIEGLHRNGNLYGQLIVDEQ